MSKTRDLETRIERLEQQLRLLQRVSRLMTRDGELDDTLHEIVTLIHGFLECDSCLVYLLEDDELVLAAAMEETRTKIGRVRLRLSEGLTGWVARERRILAISSEAYHDPRFKFFKDLPQDTFEAFLSVPIICQNRVAGVINVQHQAQRIHSGSDIEMLSTLGEQVGCALALLRQKHDAIRSPASV